MKVYKIMIKSTECGQVGFGVSIDGNDNGCTELCVEDSIVVRGLLDSVARKLYHDGFMKEYGECPTCNVKSIFGDEPQ